MKFLQLKSRATMLPAILAIAFSLVACAGNPAMANCPDNERVNQSFSFDRRGDESIEILDYFYGVPNCPAISNLEDLKRRGESLQWYGQTGPMRRAQKLYVKWRIKSTGQEYEDTVDLSNRLPKDMTNHRVYFTIRQNQLYVYLITPERRPPEMPPNDGGPQEYAWRMTITIYPIQITR